MARCGMRAVIRGGESRGSIRKKMGRGTHRGEDSLLERVTAAAEECQLSQNSLLAYRRTWLKTDPMGGRRRPRPRDLLGRGEGTSYDCHMFSLLTWRMPGSAAARARALYGASEFRRGNVDEQFIGQRCLRREARRRVTEVDGVPEDDGGDPAFMGAELERPRSRADLPARYPSRSRDVAVGRASFPLVRLPFQSLTQDLASARFRY